MKLGLIKGRHEIPHVEGRYIFVEDLNPTDVKEAEGKAYSVLAGIKAISILTSILICMLQGLQWH